MTTQLTDLIARWDENEGKPYKGSLFDFGSFDGIGEPPLSCMCAQGQVLHVVAGWGVDDFRHADQANADLEVAKLLGISRAHSVLLRQINDTIDGAPAIVLRLSDDGIGKVLGSQWSKLLDFWHYLDSLDAEQWAAAWAAARTAARTAAWAAARAAAWAAARDAAWASSEIQGSHIFAAAKRPFFFLPVFGFASPADIPARPANYGLEA